MNIKRVVRSMAERKIFDVQGQYVTDTTRVTNAGVLVDITSVTQGLGDINRIGDKVTGTSLELRFCSFSTASASAQPYWMIRVTGFIWKDDNVPVQADIYDIPASGFATLQPSLWPFNHDRKVKRKILCDFNITALDGNAQTISATKNGAGTSAEPYIFRKMVIPLTKIGRLNVIDFNNASTTGVNKIFLFLSSNATSAVNAWDIVTYTRYNFIDM